MDETARLRRQRLQPVVRQVQEQQVRQVDEQLARHLLDAALKKTRPSTSIRCRGEMSEPRLPVVAEVEDEQGLGALEAVGHLAQRVVAEVERGQLLGAEQVGRQAGRAQPVVAQVQRAQARQLRHLAVHFVHVVAPQAQVLLSLRKTSERLVKPGP